MGRDDQTVDRRAAWRRRGPFLLMALAASLVVGGAGLVGLWEFSSSPTFCSSCHIMRPYVNAWKSSTHNDVACVQCHYPPGFRDTLWVKYQAVSQVAKWATRTYSSKPFAEVEDASCLRSGCHSPTQLETGTAASKLEIKFDHRPHLEQTIMGRQLRCASCHSQIVVERHFEVNKSTCFLCHFKGMRTGRELTPIAGCTGCHQAPKGDIVVGSIRFSHKEMVRRGVACQKCHLNVIEGEGEAPSARCFTCHNQPEKLERYPDTPFIHDFHVAGHNIECARCHTEIRHKLPPLIGMPAAGRVSGTLARVRFAAAWPGQ
ncbi:MAG: NapC/NirT family cytochrome c [Candidatus Methylomirabilia bacterium]